jgi:hypothetical protein
MHSSALSELRGLYEPSFSPRTAPASGELIRRTRKSDQTETTAPAPAAAPPRARDAAQVRGMLAGFRAGVERGRGSATEPTSDDDPTTPTS